MFFFSSLSPAIAALIFFCFLANADHKPTVYKSKNYKPFKVTIQKPRMQVKKSAGKILRKSTLQLKPPSLPLEIFWEYGKRKEERKVEIKCLEERKLVTYMLTNPNLCHQEKFSSSSPTSPAQCLSSIAACNSSKASAKEERGVYCFSSTEILCSSTQTLVKKPPKQAQPDALHNQLYDSGST